MVVVNISFRKIYFPQKLWSFSVSFFFDRLPWRQCLRRLPRTLSPAVAIIAVELIGQYLYIDVAVHFLLANLGSVW